MGDRAMVSFCGSGYETPAVYLHWHGSDVPRLLREAAPRLRKSDPSYACARFVQHVANRIEGSLSIGIVSGDEGDGVHYVLDMSTGRLTMDGVELAAIDPATFYQG